MFETVSCIAIAIVDVERNRITFLSKLLLLKGVHNLIIECHRIDGMFAELTKMILLIYSTIYLKTEIILYSNIELG